MNTIQFPDLFGGLEFNINPVALEIGDIKIYWYGIIIALGFMLAVLLGMKDSRKFGIDPENIIDLVLFAAPVGIICARLYYVIFNLEYYINNPSEIYRIWHGGLAIYGGIIGAIIVAYFFAKRRKIRILNLLDLGMPYFLMAQAIGRWGNFINQEAFGSNTSLPWGMTGDKISSYLIDLELQGYDVDPYMPVHPTFFYEFLWNIIGFAILLWYRKRRKREGEVFCLYMIWYGAGRAWIEGLRTDSLMLGPFRVSQVLSVILAIAFLIIFILRRKNKENLQEQEAQVTVESSYRKILKEMQKEENGGSENAEAQDNSSQDTVDVSDKVSEDASNKDNKDYEVKNEDSGSAVNGSEGESRNESGVESGQKFGSESDDGADSKPDNESGDKDSQ